MQVVYRKGNFDRLDVSVEIPSLVIPILKEVLQNACHPLLRLELDVLNLCNR